MHIGVPILLAIANNIVGLQYVSAEKYSEKYIVRRQPNLTVK
jgi:hypothetical protein